MTSETSPTPAEAEPEQQDQEPKTPEGQTLDEVQEDAAEERKKGGYQ